MKNDIVAAMAILVAVIIIIALVQGKRARDHEKMLKELRRQHERQVDRKVKLSRGKRFDCPACGSVEPCDRCLRR